MSGEAVTRYMSFEEIQNYVDSFLSDYYPEGSIPIPIEEIIDLNMGLNIIPIPHLRVVFQSEGFLSNDLQSIWVDEYAAVHYESRYRFTLAHEIGHRVLHRHFYESVDFEDAQQWLGVVNSISKTDLDQIEFQANEFAGRLLVPRSELSERLSLRVKTAKEHGVSIPKLIEQEWEILYDDVADDFGVSGAVIQRRVSRENLKELFK